MTENRIGEIYVSSSERSLDDWAERGNLARHIRQTRADEIKKGPEGGLAEEHWPSVRAVSDVYLDLFDNAGIDTSDLRAMPFGADFYKAMDEVILAGNPTLEADNRTRNHVPPGHVHWQRRARGVLFDFRNGDLLTENLAQAGLSLKEGGRYLDFGCSSGRTVRTFAGAYPDMSWAGVDPLDSSIEWAAPQFPEIDLHVNGRWPVMPEFENGSLDGMYALSIWSHFSEVASLEWLNEMHRIVKPGGFAMITSNGFSEILRRLWIKEGERGHLERDVLQRAYNGLVANGFYFEPDLMKWPEFEDQSHWSHTFICRKWFRALEETGKWKMASYTDKQWGHKQDICILIRQ